MFHRLLMFWLFLHLSLCVFRSWTAQFLFLFSVLVSDDELLEELLLEEDPPLDGGGVEAGGGVETVGDGTLAAAAQGGVFIIERDNRTGGWGKLGGTTGITITLLNTANNLINYFFSKTIQQEL